MSEFRNKLIRLLNHTNFQQMQSSFSKFGTYTSSSRNKIKRNKESSIICEEVKYKPNDDMSRSLMFKSWKNKTMASPNGRNNRSYKTRKNYSKLLQNGSMKDIHSSNCFDSFVSSNQFRGDYTLYRNNSVKDHIEDYKKVMINDITFHKPISSIQRRVLESSLKPIPVSLINEYSINNQMKFNIPKKNNFNVLQVNNQNKTKKKFLPQFKITPFRKTNSYTKLFYTGEIADYRNGFPLYDN